MVFDGQNQQEHPSNVEVHVLDIDHCLAGKKVQGQDECGFLTTEDLKSNNNEPSVFETEHAELLSKIKPDHHIICGSNRVTPYVDLRNIDGYKTLSLTEYLKAAQKKTGATLDTFLMGDVINNEEVGACWEKTEKGFRGKTDAEEKYFKSTEKDDSKINLIYTIIQHLAHKHITLAGKKNLTVRFYDDNAWCLQDLERFYNFHKNLIPQGVKLELNHYAPARSNKPEYKTTIEGTGVPHANFRESVQVLAKAQFKTFGDVNAEVQKTIEIGAKPPTFHIFDIDGCLTDSAPGARYSPDDLEPANDNEQSPFVQDNKELFDQITPNDVILCGSNRISRHVDLKNVYRPDDPKQAHTLSLHKYLEAIKNYRKATLDPFLFWDLNPNLKPGDTYAEIKDFWSSTKVPYKFYEKERYNEGRYEKNQETPKIREFTKEEWKKEKKAAEARKTSKWWRWQCWDRFSFSDATDAYNEDHPNHTEPDSEEHISNDTNKISLIYAIVQHIAKEYLRRKKEGENLVVKFYDDKAGILEVLKDVYTLFPQLIPEGITLELYQYGNNGEWVNRTPALQGSIKGTGVPHAHFRQTAPALGAYLNKFKDYLYYGEGCKAIVTQSVINQVVTGSAANGAAIKDNTEEKTIYLGKKENALYANPFYLYELFHRDNKKYYRYTLAGKGSSTLIDFFKKYPKLIPSNVTLVGYPSPTEADVRKYGRDYNQGYLYYIVGTESKSDAKSWIGVYNEQRKIAFQYRFATAVILVVAAVLMGVAATEVLDIAFEDLGNSAEKDLDDGYGGQYLCSTALFLSGGFAGYKANKQYESREDAIEKKGALTLAKS